MVDVRKSLVLLALFALIAGGAFAQVQVTCTLGSAQNLPIRDGGLSELVGTVQMSCTNPTGAPVAVNFGAIMNTTVSNRISSSTTLVTTDATISGTAPDGTPIPAVLGAIQHRPETGDVANTRNQIVFGTITIPTTVPGGTPVQLVISGIRVVAPPASTSFTPTTVVETITTSPFGAVNIPNPQSAVVGTVTAGLTVNLTTCSGGSFSTVGFAQCVNEPSGTSWNANVKFTEAFASAFKTVDDDPGATTGTDLVAKFINLPAGVKIFVTSVPVISSVTGVVGTPIQPTATLAEGTATVDEALGTTPVCTGLPANVAVTGPFSHAPTSGEWVELAVTSGTATASWEITADNATGTDSLSFGVLVVFTSNTAAGLPGVTTTSGPAQVQGEFGPVAGPDSASRTAPVPRFRDNPVFTGNLFNISPCVTNLLFPYVTLAPNFDTGIAISNTSLDHVGSTTQPFNTTTQKGTCTAFYFAGGVSPAAPAPQVTTSPDPAHTQNYAISAGEVYSFALSQGGIPNSGSTVPAGFTGYMIVRCNFQFAHGFAFVSDFGAQKLAMGYLALVIPDTTRVPRPFSVNTTNVGEILGN